MSHTIDQDKAGKTSLQKFGLSVFRFMSYFRGLNKVAFIFFPCLFFYGTAFSSAVQCPPLQYVLDNIDSNNQVNYKGSLFVNDVSFSDLSRMKRYKVFRQPVRSDYKTDEDYFEDARSGKDFPYTKKPTFRNGACFYHGPMRIAQRPNCNCGNIFKKNEAIKLKLKTVKK